MSLQASRRRKFITRLKTYEHLHSSSEKVFSALIFAIVQAQINMNVNYETKINTRPETASKETAKGGPSRNGCFLAGHPWELGVVATTLSPLLAPIRREKPLFWLRDAESPDPRPYCTGDR